jgi:hypothetical protein
MSIPPHLRGSVMARHFINVGRHQPRVGPEELPGAIGLLADADKPGEIFGIRLTAR